MSCKRCVGKRTRVRDRVTERTDAGNPASHLYGDHQYDTYLSSCSYCNRCTQQLVSRFDRCGFRPWVRGLRSRRRRLCRPANELRPSGLVATVLCGAAVFWCAADFCSAAVLCGAAILFYVALFRPIARRGVSFLLRSVPLDQFGGQLIPGRWQGQPGQPRRRLR